MSSWTVSAEHEGERVDVFVNTASGIGRTRAKALCAEGAVRIERKGRSRVAKKSDRVREGDVVSCASALEPGELVAPPTPSLPLTVVYECDAFVVVDKPAGMAMHPLREGEDETLCNALVARYPEMQGVGYGLREPGILHRLDNETSGLVIAAREQNAFEALRGILRSGAIDKRYRAWVSGRPRAPGLIDLPLAHDAGAQQRMVACFDERDMDRSKARSAQTEVLSRVETVLVGAMPYSLVEVRAASARRHQVRVHLAAYGHPLVGDALYGGVSLVEGDHHRLHASFLGWTWRGERVEVASEPPSGFSRGLYRG